ncbi:MAG: AAA family ATPase [Tannerellaceae bacterium]|nr:AAA family ATPase [Tannerellaceae bacterium]
MMTENYEYSLEETEQAVVCTLLVKPQHLPEVAGWLQAHMFSSPRTAFIFEALMAQYERGETPDFLTTETEMRRIHAQRCKEMGGLSCLSEILPRVRTAANLSRYAEEVKRHYLLRQIRATATQAAGKAALEETDPLQLIGELEKQLLNIRGSGQHGAPLRNLADHIQEALDQHTDRINRKQSDYSVCTGFKDLDYITGGWQPGELYILAGRPADGKTAISLQIASNAAIAGKKVGVFSLEMSGQQLVNRLLATHTHLAQNCLRISALQKEDLDTIRQQIGFWKEKSFFLDYTPGNSVENIRAQVLMMKKQVGCDLVIIDYLHMMEGNPRRGETVDQVVGRNVKALKQLALEAGCSLLLLSQMNRQSENRAEKKHLPQLNDLRDSGVIEQVADGVLFVYRPDRHGITQDEHGNSLQGICQLILSKFRHGPTGTVNLTHNPSFTKFTN